MNLLLINSTPVRSTPHMIHTLNQHDAGSAQNSFALTVCVEVILLCKFSLDNQNSLNFNQPQYKSRLKAEIETENK